MAKIRTVKILNQTAQVSENASKHIFNWGANNKLPNEWISACTDSGTAMSCIDKLHSFITANGFEEEGSNDFMVNPGQNAKELLNEVAGMQTAYFDAVALNVKYRLDGTPGSVYSVPLRKLRYTDNGDFAYNDKWGEKKFKDNETINIPAFNPKRSPDERRKLISEDIKNYGYQRGEILLHFTPSPAFNGDIYPIPKAYSGYEDIEADAALQREERRNIKKGFKGKVYITLPGKLDDTTEDENGKTEADSFSENVKSFVGEEAKEVIVLESDTPEGKIEVGVLPMAQILDGIEGSRERVPRAVCRHFGVPPVLIGFDVANILGNAQALASAVQVFELAVNKKKQLVEAAFEKIWPHISWKITRLNVFDYLPPEVVQKLTDDELRAMGGFSPLPKEQSTEAQNALTLLTGMSPLLAQNVMNQLTKEEVLWLIGLGPKPQTINIPQNGPNQ